MHPKFRAAAESTRCTPPGNVTGIDNAVLRQHTHSLTLSDTVPRLQDTENSPSVPRNLSLSLSFRGLVFQLRRSLSLVRFFGFSATSDFRRDAQHEVQAARIEMDSEYIHS